MPSAVAIRPRTYTMLAGLRIPWNSSEHHAISHSPEHSSTSPTEKPRSSPNQWRIAAGVSALVAIVTYLNVLPNDYCYDDIPIVEENTLITGAGQWTTIWTTDYWGFAKDRLLDRDLLYRPVTLTSFRLVRALAGPSPLPQHVVNILLHALACCLLIFVCGHLDLSLRSATAAGLIFAVLPIHSEAIAAVVGRADLLVAVAILMAILSQRRAYTAQAKATKFIWLGVTSVLAFIAMASKESGIAVAPVFFAWELYLRGRTTTPQKARRFDAFFLAHVASLALPLVGYLALRYFALGGALFQPLTLSKTVNVLVDAPPWQHALGALQLWGMYWAKTIWPATLCAIYSVNAVTLPTTILDPQVLLGIAILAALVVMTLRAWRRRSWAVLFVLAALLICYLPTSNTVVLIHTYFAERTWYLPSIWTVILIACLVGPVLHHRLVVIIGVIILAGAGIRTWIRTTEWRNNGTLFAAAYRDHPDGVQSLYLFGQWLAGHDQRDEGIKLLTKAIRFDPGFVDAHRALGQAYLNSGRPTLAIEHLTLANLQSPGHALTESALQLARTQAAEQSAQELARLRDQASKNPDNLDLHLALIRRLRDLGRTSEALDTLHNSEDRFGSIARWQQEYAVTLVFAHRPDEAIRHYRTALDIAPTGQSAVELAMLLMERQKDGDLDEAWKLSNQAATLAPESPMTFVCHAELLALRGNISGAKAAYHRAIELLPPDSPERNRFLARSNAIGR